MKSNYGKLAWTRSYMVRYGRWESFSIIRGSVRNILYIGWIVVYVPRWGIAPEAMIAKER